VVGPAVVGCLAGIEAETACGEWDWYMGEGYLSEDSVVRYPHFTTIGQVVKTRAGLDVAPNECAELAISASQALDGKSPR
jgi:hypothetical protein